MKPVASFTGHRAAVYALTKGLEARTFLSGGGDGQVVQWNLDDPDQGVALASLDEAVFSLFVDPFRRSLVIGTGRGRLVVLDLEARMERQVIQCGARGVFRVVPSEDGVLTAGGDGVLGSWKWTDDRRLETVRSLPLCEEKLRDILLDQEQCLVACGDGSVRFLDRPWMNEVGRASGHDGSAYCLTDHPTKPVVLSGGKDGRIRIWSLEDGGQVHAFAAHSGAVYGLLSVSDRIVSAGRDAMIKVWDLASLDPVDRSEKGSGSHSHSVNDLLALDGHVITAGDDRRIYAWKVAQR